MLVCVDDFSNYIMVELIKNKRAATLLNVLIKIVKRERAIPVIVYCDNGSEFNNKLFTDRKTNGFHIQFIINRHKAVYVERAIRTICRSLEQYYAGRPNESTANYRKSIKQLVKSHNDTPSIRAPKLPN